MMMDSITKMVGVIETALLSIEEVTEPSPIDMLYALQDRLEAARAEVEEVHRYLDECFVNDPDEGRAVPLIDRAVLLVSRIARDGGEVEALREQVEWRKTQLEIANAATRRARDEAIIARADAIKLREQVATLARQSASHDFLSDAKDEIWELFVAVRDDFDGSEYQQGKKDGLRSALALLGTPEMIAFNREGGMANAANSSQDAR